MVKWVQLYKSTLLPCTVLLKVIAAFVLCLHYVVQISR